MSLEIFNGPPVRDDIGPAGVGIAISPDGQLIAVASTQARRFGVYNRAWRLLPEPEVTPPAACGGCAFSPDGAMLVLGIAFPGGVMAYDTTTWEVVSLGGEVSEVSAATAVVFNADGTLLAVGSASSVLVFSTDDWSQVASLSIGGVVSDVAFSPDGGLLAVTNTTASPRIQIFNTSTWVKLADPSTLPAGAAYSCAFNPAGTLLAVRHASSPLLRIYNVSTWSVVPNVFGPTSPLGKIAFSPDGTRLAIPVASGAIPRLSVLESPSWNPDSSFGPLGVEGQQISAVWLPDGDRVAVSTSTTTGLAVYQFTPYVQRLPLVVRVRAGLALRVRVLAGVRLNIRIRSGMALRVSVVRNTYAPVLSLRIQLATPYTRSLPIAVSVIDPAVVGGLDGAASWAAAPDGRWQAVVMLDTATDISERIAGEVVVEIAADAARTAEFTWCPAEPVSPMSLIGRRVRIAFTQAGGLNAQTIFRGVIDVPTVDLDEGTIRCACTDNAPEIVAAMPREVIDAAVGGRWHVAVTGEPADTFEYLEARLRSVGASWALDEYLQLRILPWQGAARTAAVQHADVIESTLQVDMPSREQLRTQVDVRLQYRYPVLRARGITAQWQQSPWWFIESFADNKPSYLRMTTAMVESAARSAPGWDLRSLTVQTWAPGFYPIPGGDGAGVTVRPDTALDLALGFTGRYSARWQQMVTEEYAIAVRAPAVRALLGADVAEELGATLVSQFDAADWQRDNSVAPQLDVPLMGDVQQPWEAAGATAEDAEYVLLTLLDSAWVRLWGASRTGRVRFALPCRPDFWLDMHASVQHADLSADGAVVGLTHRLSLASGQATTDVVLAVGLDGATPQDMPEWVLPPSPFAPMPPPIEALSATIGTYIGGLATSPPYNADSMIGFTTNAERVLAEDRNFYPHQLSIGWPGIDAADRDPLTVTAEAAIDVSIPTDQLELTP